MNDTKTQRVRIDVYDADGERRKVIEADMDAKMVSETMQSILENDGIHVISDIHSEACCGDTEDRSIKHQFPLSVKWKIGDVEFSATGDAQTVRDTESSFLAFLPDTHKLLVENSTATISETIKKFSEQFVEMFKNV